MHKGKPGRPGTGGADVRHICIVSVEDRASKGGTKLVLLLEWGNNNHDATLHFEPMFRSMSNHFILKLKYYDRRPGSVLLTGIAVPEGSAKPKLPLI